MNDYALLEVLVPRVGFQWIDAALEEEPKRKRRLLVGNPGPLFFVRDYQLFDDEPVLFRRFADIDPAEDKILRFANQYGWLGIEKKFLYGDESPRKQSAPEVFEGKLGEPLDVWRHEISWMSKAVRIWELLRAKDTDALLPELEDRETLDLVDRTQIAEATRVAGAATYDPAEIARRVTGKGRIGIELPFGIITASSVLQSQSDRRNPEAVLEVGVGALWSIVNWKLVPVSIGMARVGKSSKGPVPLTLHALPKNLLAGLWLQLALAIQGNKRIVRCRQCQTWFQPSAKAQRDNTAFCSTKCRVREYRQRVDEAGKLAQKGKSVAEIAHDLRTDADTVRGWIKGTPAKRSKSGKRKAARK